MRGLFLVALAGLAQFAPIGSLHATTDVVTAPVNRVDDSAARERDRERKRELAKLEHRYSRQLKKCRDGDHRACGEASETWAAIQLLQQQQDLGESANSPA